MLPALTTRFSTLLRWPRRIAALLCLLLAALTAGHPGSTLRGQHAETPAPTALPPGQVAVPVPVRGDATAYLHPGARISLYATSDGSPAAAAGSIGEGLLVLAVPSDERDDAATVIVAADREVATKIATHTFLPYLAVLDKYP